MPIRIQKETENLNRPKYMTEMEQRLLLYSFLKLRILYM